MLLLSILTQSSYILLMVARTHKRKAVAACARCACATRLRAPLISSTRDHNAQMLIQILNYNYVLPICKHIV